jgi:hypothetical protein
MARCCEPDAHRRVVEWARAARLAADPASVPPPGRSRDLRAAFDADLKGYFRLAAAARGAGTEPGLRREAHSLLFATRVRLERAISEAASRSADPVGLALDGWFFGSSKKQGVSLRMPLSTCRPTVLCAGACYAHDVLDAVPASVVRGALNGVVAQRFEEGSEAERREILDRLCPHARKAVRVAFQEVRRLEGTGWTRRPNIRFSHVGEVVAYPAFADALARLVRELSGGGVDCVVYTRHPNAGLLDPELWVMNFTLDPSSPERRAWAPAHARLVHAAFGGQVSAEADVNFLEHHRHVHLAPIGEGRVCPATAPETRVRTCDAVRCNRCFVRLRP